MTYRDQQRAATMKLMRDLGIRIRTNPETGRDYGRKTPMEDIGGPLIFACYAQKHDLVSSHETGQPTYTYEQLLAYVTGARVIQKHNAVTLALRAKRYAFWEKINQRFPDPNPKRRVA